MKSTKRYMVPQILDKEDIIIAVPGSKSITNRALLLAALSHNKCLLKGVLFSDDSRAVLECLKQLGFGMEVDEASKQVTIWGGGGQIPNRQAILNVRSAGTAARFLTVMLALAGGEYTLEASEQMKKRPMAGLLSILRKAGAEIVCLEEEDRFPFTLRADALAMKEVSVDTDVSSQFASALLIAGVLLPEGLTVSLEGSRRDGSYIAITLRMMEQFGIPVKREGDRCMVLPAARFGVREYQIEPDVSGACYFYAMAPLLGIDVLVEQVHKGSMQGDIQFVKMLEKMGCTLEESREGLWVRGRRLTGYPGMDIDMRDFSDQTMTMAVLAVFASAKSRIRNVGHIRFQESDRIHAVVTELGRLGIRCEETDEGTGIMIYPGSVKGGEVETYEDHRMAMAFTLIGLKTGNIIIRDPQCCAKTFENYFDIIDRMAAKEPSSAAK